MHIKISSGIIVAMIVRAATAQSPPGFHPPVSKHLDVVYKGFNVTPAGITIPSRVANDTPILGVETEKADTFVAIMMDFSVKFPPDTPTNQTLLHWIQPGLAASGRSLKSDASPFAPYLPPAPPPGQTHTYGVFLYEQPSGFNIPDDFVEYFKNLTTAVENRIGFPLDKFVKSAKLGQPLAADNFLVGTPANASTTANASSTATTGSKSDSSPTIKTSSAAGAVQLAGFRAALLSIACMLLSSTF